MTHRSRILRVCLAQTFLASAITVGQVSPSPAARLVGSVVLHLVDSYGDSLMPSDVTELTVLSGTGDDVSPKQFEGTLQDLPYGEYSVRLSVPGFKYWTGTVRVAKPITLVIVGMQVGGLESNPTCALSGNLRGFKPAPAPVWIRLIQLYSDDVIEASVDSRGYFNIAGAPCAKYILAVMTDVSAIRLMIVTLSFATEPISIPFGDAQ